jgi:glycosyltransferase involved in cell wall biosynthesis
LVAFAELGLPLFYRACPILAISESSRDDLRRRGLPADHIQVSHPGIDRPARTVDLETTRPRRIVYVGRLERYKRVDLALRATHSLVERFPDLELVVIGRGSERPRLEALARELGIADRTRFTGFVEREERDALLATSRVCVLPSEKEGWGLAVIEANAVGTPVVAADVPGLRDSVREGETGLLVTAGDAAAFENGLARLLEEDAFTLDLRRRAREWSDRFDWESAADEVQQAIEHAIEGARANGNAR